jgi:anti-sigma regulatory factor (Ser/Thr protein kinase)
VQGVTEIEREVEMVVATVRTEVFRDLLAARASVGVAREFVASTLRAWRLERVQEAALAIASELVTNAVEISAVDGSVRVHLSLHRGELWLGVMDGAGGVQPVRRRAVTSLEEIDAAEGEGFGGWGLQVVQCYADRVWIEDADQPGWKWVCAAIAVG